MSSARGASRRWRLPGLDRVATISASLVATQAVTSLLGFVYWTLAARRFSVDAVGVAGAAVSLMTMLGTLGMFGLGTLLIAELPRTDRAVRGRLLRAALLVAGAGSGLLALVVAVGVHLVPADNLRPISSSPWTGLGFVVGVALTGLTLVLDQAVLALGDGGLQFERNTIASSIKIVILLVLSRTGHSTGMAIFLSWTIGNLVSLLILGWRVRSRSDARPRTGRGFPAASPPTAAGAAAAAAAAAAADPTAAPAAGTTGRPSPLVDLSILRGLARRAVSHHVLNLVLLAPMQLLPVIVTLTISAERNGYFSIVQLIAGFVFVLPYSITIGLFAAADGDPDLVVRRMRTTIPLGLAASLAADGVLYLGGGLILAGFGHDYATAGLGTLRIFVLAGLAFVIKDHYVALRRVQGRTGPAAAVCCVGGLVELVAAAVGAHLGGTAGLSAGWLLALTVEAVLLARPLWRAHRDLTPADRAVAVSQKATEVTASGQPSEAFAGGRT
ncbi:lipopolysaccharide biosynthesis protein [Frankia sp. R82]|uniref:lipopolysaccharide biosynthesis protein n=1 Tax=Frankia sp. R82 TaxID=2950553 RepID=UPI0020441C56|nr:hypothetical protein [Frankia sp. R82]MCM3887283.1 hypothetical protein [Frankia sp. R82]